MKKINIAELLRNCPSGMELDCVIYEDVYFDYVDELNIIHCYIQHETHKTSITLNQHGTPNGDIKSKCVIFPRGKTTWEGFQRPFKDGDILTTNIGSIFIFSHLELDKITGRNICKAYVGIQNTMPISLFHKEESDVFGPYESKCRFATEEEKKTLFDTIKDSGYEWNTEIKTLKKLPKFKMGDEIVKRNSISNSWIVASVNSEYYGLKLPNGNDGIGVLPISEQDDWKLMSIVPKFKVGDRITNGKTSITIGYIDNEYYYERGRNIANRLFIKNQDDWELVPNKFDIHNLRPFDKVLVRDCDTDKWNIDFFAYYREDKGDYQCMTFTKNQCIPYESNRYLMGTTDSCREYFKTWK